MEVSGQLHAPAALPPVPIGLEAGWVGALRKILVFDGNRTLVFQHILTELTRLSSPSPHYNKSKCGAVSKSCLFVRFEGVTRNEMLCPFLRT